MHFSDIALALVPVAVFIGLGSVLRRLPGFGAADFWSGVERLAYFVLLPVLLFRNVAEAHIGNLPVGTLALALVLPTLLATGLLVLVRTVVADDNRSFTSVLQGGIRFNTYIGLSLAQALFGDTGAALAAIVGAILVPLVNIVSALTFEVLLLGARSWLSLLKSVVLNPLVLSCVAGAVVNLSPISLPEVSHTVLDPIAVAALPVGLLCVGAGIRKVRSAKNGRSITAACLVKFLVLPAVTIAALKIAGVGGQAALVGLIFQSISTAPSAYVMSKQLGGNAALMAAITAVQTVVSFVVLPVILAVGFMLLN